MFRSKAFALFGLVLSAHVGAQVTHFPGIGRPATANEVKAWDIDVRPDLKGLPPGKGSVATGELIWEAKCASCHGIFGESNEVFTAIAGGIRPRDIEVGRVAALTDGTQPVRSTLMKVSQISTLWDYVNRAMPWNAPKSLTTDEVYASVAYMLHLNDIVPADFTLSHENMAAVQQRLPNRNGTSTEHGLWDVRGKPDVRAVACMKNCGISSQAKSILPDYARNAHGNLAEQSRNLGVRGVNTAGGLGIAPATDTPAASPAVALISKNGCTACHGLDNKVLGPSFAEINKKYASQSDGVSYLSARIRAGGGGVWGAIPMPPQTQLSAEDTAAIAQWLGKKM
jgi:S-disulfanyl-L-cysteine oxidoreductase SoxD